MNNGTRVRHLIKILTAALCGLPLLLSGAAGGRARIPLKDGWLVRQIETDYPDIPWLLSELSRPTYPWARSFRKIILTWRPGRSGRCGSLTRQEARGSW